MNIDAISPFAAPSRRCLAGLRQQLARIDGAARPDHGRLPTGHAGMDAALGGGLPRGRLHGVAAAAAADAGAAIGFVTGLAAMLAAGRSLLWVRAHGAGAGRRLFGAGLLAHGLDPAALLLLDAPDAVAACKAAEDGVRCAALGAVVLELPATRALGQTGARRLQLAAGQAGVTLLLLSVGADDAPAPAGDVAQTRWRVAAAPSRALAGDAPGWPAMVVGLQRQRGGPAGLCWQVEWNRNARAFEDASPAGAGHALSADRPLAARAGQAGRRRLAANA